MESKKIDIEMSNMVGKTYFKIATWFNKDFETDKERQEELKTVSAEIIHSILEDTFLQLEGVSNVGTKTISNKQNTEKPINQKNIDSGKMFNFQDNSNFGKQEDE